MQPPRRRIRHRPEQALQQALVRWLSYVAGPGVWFCHVPNSARRGVVEGRMMKAAGMVAGTPDLLLVHAGRALWLELKSDKGRLSDRQEKTIANLRRSGSHVAVVRSIEDADAALRGWGVPLKCPPLTTGD